MALALGDLPESFLRFIENQQIHHYTENFERAFFEPGETVIHAGDKGREAYYIVDGSADVLVRQGEARRCVNQLGPGDLFGELALLTEDARSADVVATSPLDTMVLGRHWFQSHIMNNLDHVGALLRLMGGRLKKTLCQIH
nr:cyclic nucleotide-binding domain-containing protein [Acanthopleuribacter pedis]